MLPMECYDRIINQNLISTRNPNLKEKPRVIMMAQCTENDLKNPFSGKLEVTRKHLWILCAVTDILTAMLFMGILSFMIKISHKTIIEFKDFNNQIETRDFAIQVTKLPQIKHYKNEQILKVLLWQHFEEIIKTSSQQIKCLAKTQKYHKQIIEIFFGMQDYGSIKKLVPSKNLFQKLSYLKTLQKNNQKSLSNKIAKVETKIEKNRQRYIKAQNKQYQTEKKKMYKIQRGNSCNTNVMMAFVVFRSMEGQQRVLAAYANQGANSCWVMFKNRICCAKMDKKKREKLPKFMDKFTLHVEQACDSNLVKWDGFGNSRCRSIIRGIVNFFMKLFFMLAAAYLLFYSRKFQKLV